VVVDHGSHDTKDEGAVSVYARRSMTVMEPPVRICAVGQMELQNARCGELFAGSVDWMQLPQLCEALLTKLVRFSANLHNGWRLTAASNNYSNIPTVSLLARAPVYHCKGGHYLETERISIAATKVFFRS
jgi:hypothetical protein